MKRFMLVALVALLLAATSVAGGINIPQPVPKPPPTGRMIVTSYTKSFFEGMRDFWAAQARIEDAVMQELSIEEYETGSPDSGAISDARELLDDAATSFAGAADALETLDAFTPAYPSYYDDFLTNQAERLDQLAVDVAAAADALDDGDVDTALGNLELQDSFWCGAANADVTDNSITVVGHLDLALSAHLTMLAAADAAECN